MGEIHVHEFMSLAGVIEAPTWTFECGFLAEMGDAIGAVTARSRGILLGRTTYEMFEPAWSTRTIEDDPGRRSSTTRPSTSCPERSRPRPGGTRARRPVRRADDPRAEGAGRRRYLRQRQREARPRAARRQAGRRAAPVRLPADARRGRASVPGGRPATEAGARGQRRVRERRRLPRYRPQ